MANAESSASTNAPAAPKPAKLDDVMLAMDVVDTLRHRARMVERELNAEARDEQLIERIRDLYKSQGIEVPDSIIAEGVEALKEDRFVYAPPKAGLSRTMATLWVKRGTYGKWAAIAVGLLVLVFGTYHFAVVKPREQAAEAARIELAETLPRDLTVAHSAIVAEAQVPEARDRADALLAEGQAALERGNAADARTAVAELDSLAETLR